MLRYGVPGQIRYSRSDADSNIETVVDIFEGRRARAREVGHNGHCCGFSANEVGNFGHPRPIVAADDPLWDECLLEAATQTWNDENPCLHPSVWGLGRCEGMLTECPPPVEPPSPDSRCEVLCPMAADGICDEAAGTGLCPDGCDATDCNCEADKPGQCDELQAGGPCPVGSDPDCA